MVKRVIVAQLGARHRYAIPQTLEEQGRLYRFYTDSTRYSFLGKIAFVLHKIGVKNINVERLIKRIPQIPRSKIYSSDSSLLIRIKDFFRKNEVSNTSLSEFYNGMSPVFKRWGVGEADCVYSMHYENIDFLRYAKSRGLKIVVDIFVAPTLYAGMKQEYERNYPSQIANQMINEMEVKMLFCNQHIEEILQIADFYTIPSQFVMDSLQGYKNYDPSKVLFLPYPSSITVGKYSYKPQKHKLIWVGNDPARKGIIYCAKAANILKEKYPELNFCIIGSGTEDFRCLPECKNLNFLGLLNKEELIHEFQSAEAYVFPTLYEGFAGTVLEAASCGCPIITTEAAGTDIDTFPAIYIPTRSVDAIVSAVEKIFNDSDFRDTLSRQVFNYAKALRVDEYNKTLQNYFSAI